MGLRVFLIGCVFCFATTACSDSRPTKSTDSEIDRTYQEIPALPPGGETVIPEDPPVDPCPSTLGAAESLGSAFDDFIGLQNWGCSTYILTANGDGAVFHVVDEVSWTSEIAFEWQQAVSIFDVDSKKVWFVEDTTGDIYAADRVLHSPERVVPSNGSTITELVAIHQDVSWIEFDGSQYTTRHRYERWKPEIYMGQQLPQQISQLDHGYYHTIFWTHDESSPGASDGGIVSRFALNNNNSQIRLSGLTMPTLMAHYIGQVWLLGANSKANSLYYVTGFDAGLPPALNESVDNLADMEAVDKAAYLLKQDGTAILDVHSTEQVTPEIFAAQASDSIVDLSVGERAVFWVERDTAGTATLWRAARTY